MGAHHLPHAQTHPHAGYHPHGKSGRALELPKALELPRALVESQSLEIFKEHADVALWDMV